MPLQRRQSKKPKSRKGDSDSSYDELSEDESESYSSSGADSGEDFSDDDDNGDNPHSFALGQHESITEACFLFNPPSSAAYQQRLAAAASQRQQESRATTIAQKRGMEEETDNHDEPEVPTASQLHVRKKKRTYEPSLASGSSKMRLRSSATKGAPGSSQSQSFSLEESSLPLSAAAFSSSLTPSPGSFPEAHLWEKATACQSANEDLLGFFSETYKGESPEAITSRCIAYERCWQDAQADVTNLLHSLNQKVFESITEFINRENAPFSTSKGASSSVLSFSEVPTVLLYAGVNVTDHSYTFNQLIDHVKRKSSPHVILLQSKDCTNLRSLMRLFVEQVLVSGSSDASSFSLQDYDTDDSDPDEDALPKRRFVPLPLLGPQRRRKVPNYTMETVQGWYDEHHSAPSKQSASSVDPPAGPPVPQAPQKGKSPAKRVAIIPPRNPDAETIATPSSVISRPAPPSTAPRESTPSISAPALALDASRRPPLVLVFSDFESFDTKVIQDFVQMCSNARSSLPIVLIFGIATSSEAIHRLLPQSVFSRLKMERYYLQHSSFYLSEIINRVLLSPRHPFRLGYRPLVALLDNFLFFNFSTHSFIRGLQFAMMEHFSSHPLSFLCLFEKQLVEESIRQLEGGSAEPHTAVRALALSHDALEQVRRLPSFRLHVESLAGSKDEQRKLLLDDSHLNAKVRHFLLDARLGHVRFQAAARAMHSVSARVPQWPLGRQWRELYVALMSSADSMYESSVLCNGDAGAADGEVDDITLAEAYTMAISVARIMSRDELTSCLGDVVSALTPQEWMHPYDAHLVKELLGKDHAILSELYDKLVHLENADVADFPSDDDDEEEPRGKMQSEERETAADEGANEAANEDEEESDEAGQQEAPGPRRSTPRRTAAVLAKAAVKFTVATGLTPTLPSAAIAATAAGLPLNASMSLLAAASGTMDARFKNVQWSAAKRRRMVLLQAATAQRLQKTFSRYEMLRLKIVTALDEMFRRHLVSPLSYPLYEAFYHQSSGSLVRSFSGRPRLAVHTALAKPHQYIKSMVGLQEEVSSDIPDTCIAYQLYRVCGRLINLYDWLRAFAAVVAPQRPSAGGDHSAGENDGKGEDDGEEQKKPGGVRRRRRGKGQEEKGGDDDDDDDDNGATPKRRRGRGFKKALAGQGDGGGDAEIAPEIHARFIRAVSELQYLGFIKATARKTDHVSKLTWGAV